jgi:hypothetical protein
MSRGRRSLLSRGFFIYFVRRTLAMRVSFICCPFKTSFGAYGSSLKSAIEVKTARQMSEVD